MKDYLFYYKPVIYFTNQNREEFDFEGLDFYDLFRFKFRIYSPQKTKIPALTLSIIIFGLGFELYTHDRK